MARRCTISLPHARPTILESFADYFIVGGYALKPFQVDIFDRTKANLVSIDVAKELSKAMHRHAIDGASIFSLSHVLVPRLKWSDRHPETFEQKKKKRIATSMDPFD